MSPEPRTLPAGDATPGLDRDLEEHHPRWVRLSPRGMAVAGVAVVGLYVAATVFYMSVSVYDTWAAMFIGPVLVLMTLPAIARQARRENDPRLAQLLLLALCVKLITSVLRYFVAYDLYGGIADAAGYHGVGKNLAAQFRDGNFDTGLEGYTDTNFIRIFTAILYTGIGTTSLGGFLVFSWLGYLGMFWFYRAFALAVPEGKRRTYAKLLFFMPSMLFWPSAIGKEAWMVFAIGLATYGVARALSGNLFKALPTVALGLWTCWLVRPHVAGLVGVAGAAAFLLRKPSPRLGTVAPVAKITSILVVGALSILMVSQAQSFLKSSGIDIEEGVTTALEQTSDRTQLGGSQFEPFVVRTPIDFVPAAFTVLFRPLVVEAGSILELLSAIEGTFLLLLALSRWQWLVAAVKSGRRQPYVWFVVAFVAMFVIAYSSIANFGILARQRVQVYPIALVLLTIPATVRRRHDDGDSEEESAPQLVRP